MFTRQHLLYRFGKSKPDCGLACLACSGVPEDDLRSIGYLDHLDYLSYKKTGHVTSLIPSKDSSSGSPADLELSCCKKQQKKSQPRNWFGE